MMKIGTIERAIEDVTQVFTHIPDVTSSEEQKKYEEERDGILHFLKLFADPALIMVEKKNFNDLKNMLNESVLVSEFANPDCDKCSGTGRMGHTETTHGKRTPVLCKRRHCSADLLVKAYSYVKRRTEKETALTKQLRKAEKDIVAERDEMYSFMRYIRSTDGMTLFKKYEDSLLSDNEVVPEWFEELTNEIEYDYFTCRELAEATGSDLDKIESLSLELKFFSDFTETNLSILNMLRGLTRFMTVLGHTSLELRWKLRKKRRENRDILKELDIINFEYLVTFDLVDAFDILIGKLKSLGEVRRSEITAEIFGARNVPLVMMFIDRHRHKFSVNGVQ